MKVLLLGDSITAGLGSKKINFTSLLKRKILNSTIINFAKTGTTIDYVLENYKQIDEFDFDYVILLYGSVDAQIRPNQNGKFYNLLPKRFKSNNGSMLSPRPFYSKNFFKHLFQIIENFFRKLFRNLVILIDGTEQWVKIDDFEKKYSDVCYYFKEKNKKVICCSCFYIDDKYFKGSTSEYLKYNECIKKIAKKNKIKYIDFYSKFKDDVEKNGWKKSFNHDHFHPNENGYEYISTVLAKEIINY